MGYNSMVTGRRGKQGEGLAILTGSLGDREFWGQ